MKTLIIPVVVGAFGLIGKGSERLIEGTIGN